MHYVRNIIRTLTKGLLTGALLVAVVPSFFTAEPAKAAALATSYQLPCQPYSSPYYSFGQWVSGWGYHVGEDTCSAAGIPVYAVANGRVMYSAKTPDSYRWGNMIMIEHDNSDGTSVTSLYGHLSNARQVAAGQDVTKGQLIGFTGPSYTAENGNWGAHLHFGMHNGGYGAGVGAYAGWAHGYEQSFPAGWLSPSGYVNARLAAYDYSPIDASGAGPLFFTAQTEITFRVRNTGTQTWRKEGNSPNPVRLGTVGPRDHVSGFSKNGANAGWADGGTRIKMTADTAPGQIASFKATFSSNRIPGIYMPCFSVLAEGAFWMTGGANVCANLQILPPSWRATYYTQMLTTNSEPTNLSGQIANQSVMPGAKRNVKIMYKNTGEEDWDAAPGLDQVRLGTYNPKDRPSPWATGGDGAVPTSENWPVYYRPSDIDGRYDPTTNTVMPADVIKPGEIATFSFTITAPQQGGIYHEYFNPVVEGRMWMPPTGVWFEFKVIEPGAHYEYAGQSQSIQSVGTTATGMDVTLKLRNSGRDPWPVGGNFKLATDRPTDVASPFYTSTGSGAWLSPTRVSAIDRNVNDSNKTTVDSGEVAEFNFRVNVPPLPIGSYKLYLRPVIEGVAWLPEDYGVFFNINVTQPAYAYQVTAQTFTANPTYTQPNSVNTATLAIKNTGRETWKTEGPNAVRLGTARANDRNSRFVTPTGSDPWDSASRASKIEGRVTDLGSLVTVPATEIKPDETALFKVPMTANGTAGSWNEYFNLVVEGVTWMPDIGLYFPMRVTTQTGPTPVTSWSAFGHQYTSCTGSCSRSTSQQRVSSSSTPFKPTYTTGTMAAGTYSLRVDYRNINGPVPPNYNFNIILRYGTQTRTVSLPGSDSASTQTITGLDLNGVTSVSLEWTNDAYSPGVYDANFALNRLVLTKTN